MTDLLFTSNTETIIEIVMFISPGFLALLFFKFLTPIADISDFELTLWSILVSIFGNQFVASVLLPIANWIKCDQQIVLDPSSMFWASSFSSIAIILIVRQVLTSNWFEALMIKYVGKVPFSSVWNRFLFKEFHVLKVTMSDGRIYLGKLKEFDDLDKDGVADLVLWTPYEYESDTDTTSKLPNVDSILLIREDISSIESIEDEVAKEIYS